MLRAFDIIKVRISKLETLTLKQAAQYTWLELNYNMLCITVPLIRTKCRPYTYTNKQHVNSAMGMCQLSESFRDDSQIDKNLIGECFHKCTVIYKKKVNFQIQ